MDYLMGDSQQSVIVSGAGIGVTVPNPARFALHKLAISTLRPIGMRAKAVKDIAQAASILEVLLEDVPGALVIAADALLGRQDFLADKILDGAMALPVKTREALLEAVSK
jgi:hypothetical protein